MLLVFRLLARGGCCIDPLKPPSKADIRRRRCNDFRCCALPYRPCVLRNLLDFGGDPLKARRQLVALVLTTLLPTPHSSKQLMPGTTLSDRGFFFMMAGVVAGLGWSSAV